MPSSFSNSTTWTVAILMLLVLLPQAQSSRSGWRDFHRHESPHTRSLHREEIEGSISRNKEKEPPLIQPIRRENVNLFLNTKSGLHLSKLNLEGSNPSCSGDSNMSPISMFRGDLSWTSFRAATAEDNLVNGMLDSPVSGPNPGGNSNLPTSIARAVPVDDKVARSSLDSQVSGPNPGGNSHRLMESVKAAGFQTFKVEGVKGHRSSTTPSEHKKLVSSMLPRGTPVTPSGPSHKIHSAPNER